MTVPAEKHNSLAAKLRLTRQFFSQNISRLFQSSAGINRDTLKELETKLLIADLGVNITQEIINYLKDQAKAGKIVESSTYLAIIREKLEKILASCEKPLDLDTDSGSGPKVFLFVGINGSGKTTTIGKLANLTKNRGKKVLLAAGDTFRAAAVDQLRVWGERNAVEVISQKSGADSAAVIYDAFQAARARGLDILMADTAGRLHTHGDLMGELKKVKRILQKIDSSAPHEILLVLDATIGQNAINQARKFNEDLGVTGIILTKLDGTAKGGSIFAIAQEMRIPILFIGVGESINDLEPFDHKKFVEVLFEERNDLV